MKKLLFLFLITLASCSSNVKDIASYEVDGAWYWVLEHEPNATKEDVLAKVKLWANPNKTSYFFVYPNTVNLADFQSKDLVFPTFKGLIVNNPPTYGFYKMPNDAKIYDDAVWLIKQSK